MTAGTRPAAARGHERGDLAALDWYATVFELIDMRSFSNLWFWIALAVVWSTAKYIYVGPALFVSFVGGYMLIDFDTAFGVFHKIFFTNDDWILRYDDALIQLLPVNFWLVSGITILVLFSLTMGLIYFVNEKFMKKYVLN